jgi:hypothetical protein
MRRLASRFTRAGYGTGQDHISVQSLIIRGQSFISCVMGPARSQRGLYQPRSCQVRVISDFQDR